MILKINSYAKLLYNNMEMLKNPLVLAVLAGVIVYAVRWHKQSQNVQQLDEDDNKNNWLYPLIATVVVYLLAKYVFCSKNNLNTVAYGNNVSDFEVSIVPLKQ